MQDGKAIHQSVVFDKSEFTIESAKNWFKKNIKRLYDRDLKTLKLNGIGADQLNLFKTRPALELEIQDKAKSDDPLEQCLERRGYDIKKVRQMQDSISEKLTPDMFTNQTTPLNQKEKILQDEIDKCLGKTAHGSLF
jgi:hypothetical protein